MITIELLEKVVPQLFNCNKCGAGPFKPYVDSKRQPDGFRTIEICPEGHLQWWAIQTGSEDRGVGRRRD